MSDYTIFKIKLFKYHCLKTFFRIVCNFIPSKNLRRKTRKTLNDKFASLPLYDDSIIFLKNVDTHLPKKVLAQMNAYDNEYFINENRKIAQGGGITLIVAILNMMKTPKTPNPHSILGLL